MLNDILPSMTWRPVSDIQKYSWAYAVIPADAGIQVFSDLAEGKKDWIPACAGMTESDRPRN
jgi:hypothetical protein